METCALPAFAYKSCADVSSSLATMAQTFGVGEDVEYATSLEKSNVGDFMQCSIIAKIADHEEEISRNSFLCGTPLPVVEATKACETFLSMPKEEVEKEATLEEHATTFVQHLASCNSMALDDPIRASAAACPQGTTAKALTSQELDSMAPLEANAMIQFGATGCVPL